jgi:multidrug resistance efflux pump
MAKDSQTTPSRLEQALGELTQLRHFTGAPKDFWPRFLAATEQLAQTDMLVLLARNSGQPWRRVLGWPTDSQPSRMLTVFFTRLEEIASQAAAAGGWVGALEGKASPVAANFVVGVPLALPTEECILASLLSETSEAGARDAALRLRVAAQTAELYQAHLTARQASGDVEKFASVLDLAVSLSTEQRFLATALAFCNGLATRFNCERVSLGWLEGGFMRLRSVSRTEKFDRQMGTAQELEAAMEEALDQDEEVVWPPLEGCSVIGRDHERLAKDQELEQVCSLPLRANQKPVSVVTCQRQSPAFSEAELQRLRLACDLAAPRLAELHQRDRWFGARWAAQVREGCAKLLGPEHTWAKLLVVVSALVLAALFCVRVPYRVQGNFTLRSEELAYVTAPFEGYIERVLVRPGDAVRAGAPLLQFKTAELELEQSYALADLNRYQREAEKARSVRALAEMRISEALADQADARLGMVRYRLEHAVVKCPFDAVVVEGDLREHLGAPVKTADVLFKVARTDALYVEAEVNERDVHEILGRSRGQIAFVSQPRKKFPVRIIAVEQAATPKNDANVFLVRCSPDSAPQAWWRPGMSGVCKLSVEKRTLIWILTHRTVDFLRLKLWW